MVPSTRADSDADFALAELLSLIEDYHDFNPEPTVPVFSYPTELKFSQQVAKARPCVYQLDRDVLNCSERERQAFAARADVKAETHRELVDQRSSRSALSDKADCLREEQRSILAAACFSWTKQRLCELLTEDVEVAVTPDGRADSLYSVQERSEVQRDGEKQTQKLVVSSRDPEPSSSCIFLQPAATRMSMSRLIDELCPQSLHETLSTKPIFYLQSQDSNLSRSELAPLLPDLPATPPPFALSVLGDPEATNIWIGNHDSVTSTHRDPYENLYLVIKGRKKFVLYAPVEEVCLHAGMVSTGKWLYDEKSGQFEIERDDDRDEADVAATDGGLKCESKIPWIPIDPLEPPATSSIKYPDYKHARPLTVSVEEGQMLYLPAGWFHHVRQECGTWNDQDGNLVQAPCIAVNYWYDMDYSGERHVMREMVGKLVQRARSGAHS
jgi:peptidyl-lysine (3S)-dioxygenase / protease